MSNFRRRLYRSKSTDYIQDGLILSLDATRNTGNGFSEDADYWKDLSGNGNDAQILNPGDGMWLNGAFDALHYQCRIVSDMLDVDEVTMQIVTNTTDLTIHTGELGTRFSGSYGIDFDGLAGRNPRFGFVSSKGRYFANNGAYYYLNDKPYMVTLRCSKEKTISDVYAGKDLFGTFSSPDYVYRSGFGGGAWLPTSRAYGRPSVIYSFRVYGRILTPEEIASNYEVEKGKFKII